MSAPHARAAGGKNAIATPHPATPIDFPGLSATSPRTPLEAGTKPLGLYDLAWLILTLAKLPAALKIIQKQKIRNVRIGYLLKGTMEHQLSVKIQIIRLILAYQIK